MGRGGYRNWSRKRDGVQAHERHLAGLHERSRAAGCELQAFLPRKGDALIWNADLVHGGGPVSDAALTRHSLVCHYCPADVRPFYFSYKPQHRDRIELRPGCLYSSTHFPLRAAGSR